jgi:hypothetical protein
MVLYMQQRERKERMAMYTCTWKLDVLNASAALG